MDEIKLSVFSDKLNRRIRVDEYQGELSAVEKEIVKNRTDWVEKLIIKVKFSDFDYFISRGYVCEGYIPHYFTDEALVFMCKYFSQDRLGSKNYQKQQEILRKSLESGLNKGAENYDQISNVEIIDAEEIAGLFERNLPIYPTPMYKAAYVAKTIQEGTIYKVIRVAGKIVSVASAELNSKFKNAELTDCVTLPDFRGRGFMIQILKALELELNIQGYRQIYTLARAGSEGINRAFYKLGFTYGGCLINNCFIGSGMEDMNIWYKYR